jgi:hypothetical protein
MQDRSASTTLARSRPLNYFVYPYVEVDSGKYTADETTYSYTEVPL